MTLRQVRLSDLPSCQLFAYSSAGPLNKRWNDFGRVRKHVQLPGTTVWLQRRKVAALKACRPDATWVETEHGVKFSWATGWLHLLATGNRYTLPNLTG